MLLCMPDRHVEITFVTKACQGIVYTTKLASRCHAILGLFDSYGQFSNLKVLLFSELNSNFTYHFFFNSSMTSSPTSRNGAQCFIAQYSFDSRKDFIAR